jgi:hypothetical protein
MGSQAKAPAPLDRKPFSVTVGQALPPANSDHMPIFSRLLRESVPLSSWQKTPVFQPAPSPPLNQIKAFQKGN